MKRQILILFLLFISCSVATHSQERARWRQVFPKNVPEAREGLGMAKLTEGKVLMFGGRNQNIRVLNDTWIFDYKTQEWIEIFPTNAPESRGGLCLSQISEGKVLMYGGTGENSEFLDTWLFDINTMEWQNLNPKDSCEYRTNFGMCNLSEGNVIVFGESLYESYGTYKFDLQTNNWKLISYGEIPGPRASCGLAKLDSNMVILYGGGDIIVYNSTYIYNYKSRKWTEIFPKTIPKKRYAFGFTDLTQNKVISFGGSTEWSDSASARWNNDTWIFNLNDSNWKEILYNNKPLGRLGHSCSNLINNKLLLFGGINKNTTLNDTWIFDFDSLETGIENDLKITENIKVRMLDGNKIEINDNGLNLLKIKLFDILGIDISYDIMENTNNRIIIQTSQFLKGVYFLKMQNETETKIVKIIN